MNSKQFQELFDIVFRDSVKKVSLDLILDINFFQIWFIHDSKIKYILYLDFLYLELKWALAKLLKLQGFAISLKSLSNCR